MTQEELQTAVGSRFDVRPETDPIWGRPWRVTCKACGMVFHPLPTSRAIERVLHHNTVVAKRIVECA